jgi:hypothetical protein
MEILERANHTGVRGIGKELIFHFFFFLTGSERAHVYSLILL